MRIVEARFHPAAGARPGASLAVAHVYCDREGASVEAIHSALAATAALQQLRDLIASLDSERVHQLEFLRHENWSFKPVLVSCPRTGETSPNGRGSLATLPRDPRWA
jgi:hypothetical protein